MNRCAFCEWMPILPWPVWPLAGQCLFGQNVVVGSMIVLLALCGSRPRGVWWTPIFVTSALHHGSVQSYPHTYSGVILVYRCRIYACGACTAACLCGVVGAEASEDAAWSTPEASRAFLKHTSRSTSSYPQLVWAWM